MNQVVANKYPLLEINLEKIHHNVKSIVELCKKSNIQVSGVIKGFNGLPQVASQFVKGGCANLATSRMDQIIELREAGFKEPFMLIRIPMLSEVKDVVNYVDISLNSEVDTCRAINQECILQNKTHKVILMIDMGDLREGYWDKKELLEVAHIIEKELKSLQLIGIGTNLGCYGAISPTEENMQQLVSIAEAIEAQLGRTLEIISGGATSSLPLVMEGKMPKRVNHLRIGEGIILARDLPEFWGVNMSFMHNDAMTLKAEVVEIKNKPSHPVGKIMIDAFGNTPTYKDRGMRKRALLALGKLDIAVEDKIIPREQGIEVIGSSSDHLIIDIEGYKGSLKIGDILEFDSYYPAMMYLTNSRYTNIKYV